MPGALDDRAVLITGAASGIGRATALRAASAGAIVAALDVDDAGLDSLVHEAPGRVTTSCVDVADRAALRHAIASVIDELGPLHAVVANAGVLVAPRPSTALDLDEWDRVLAVDLTAAVMTVTESLAGMRDGGVVLLCGSSLAIRPREGRLAYVAAKAGLHAVGRALALELAPRRIRVNVLAPGLTDTPMVHAIPGHVETGLPSVPLGDLVPPEEVAALAVHLMTDDASHVTGTVLSIDGGRTAG